MKTFSEYVKSRNESVGGAIDSVVGRPIMGALGALGHGAAGLAKGVAKAAGDAGYGFWRGMTQPGNVWHRMPEEEVQDAKNAISKAYGSLNSQQQQEVRKWLCQICK